MAEKKWTPMQKMAIDTRDKTLLVSAAAGSGKTATLTERIIQSILDPQNPLGIEDMLIVTFTKLAAGELRERIGGAIKKAISERPGDKHLERQLHLLPGARICTIDSFCADILRQNCERVGVPPNFRVPDEAECALLAENTYNGLFSGIYEGILPEVATPEELSSLAECLTDTGGQSELAVILTRLYKDTLSTVEGVDSLLPLVEEYNPNSFTRVEHTRFGAYCMSRLQSLVTHYRRVFRDALREVELRGNEKLVKLENMLREECEYVELLSGAKTYTEAKALLDGRVFSTAAQNKDPTLPPTTSIRAAFKSEIIKLREGMFMQTEEHWRIAYEGLWREMSTLMRIIRKFDELFRKEKLRRGLCEFSDIERYTYECLWQDGELTDIALSQRKIYSAIYIDEYQDVNSLQHAIFEALARENNRFMVGDIKQSIYGFRSANADIFANMKRAYPDIREAKDSPMAAIFMSNNFRCDRGIIDFVNTVFDRIFGIIGDSIGYAPSDRLVFSKVAEGGAEPEYKYPEVCLIDGSGIKAERKGDADFDSDMLSPYTVAEKIRELLANGRLNDGSPVTPGDIAIIMRSAKGRSMRYKRALDEYGIPSALAEETKFFLTPEALLALCLFNSIDNPHKDIYLAGLMVSPLYSFTEDELVRIRRAGGDCLYESLKLYVLENDYPKGRKFLSSLEKYRLLAEGTPTDMLISRLYKETGLLALAAKNGGRDRLLQLYEYARSYEKSSFKGLYNFLSYLNSIIERKNALDKREAPNDKNAVNIITSHGSKGLEFPIIFYVEGETLIGGGSQRAPRFEYAEGFGLGMFTRTPKGMSLVKNATKAVIKDYKDKKQLEEETRILYVTLTRAREQLYVVGVATKAMKDYKKDIEYYREYLSQHTVYSIGTLFKLLIYSSGIELLSPEEFLSELPAIFTDNVNSCCHADTAEIEEGEFILPSNSDTSPDIASKEGEDSPYILGEVLDERFSYKYPRRHLTTMPEKLSVSVLYPRLLDGSDEGVTSLIDDSGALGDITFIMQDGSGDSVADDADTDSRPDSEREIEGLGILPDFISGKERRESAKRGIATHQLLQFCNLDRLYEWGAERELQALISERYLSERDGERVRLNEVELFRNSQLLKDMRSAVRLWRELRFNVRLPATLFATQEESKKLYEGETVLVQGVIDCLYEDCDGNLHLIDYKTDRLTREELRSPDLAERKLREAHELQLNYYAEAVERMLGRRPVTVEVYSMPLGKTVNVKK